MSVHKATYATGQLEKGKEGTVHLQYFICFPEQKTLTALKKLCRKSHFEPVVVDNGAADYCNKVDTRIEGPWEFGTKPLRQNVKGECKEARAVRNKMLLETDLDTLQASGEIAL